MEQAAKWAGAGCRCGLDNADSTSPSIPRIFGGKTVNKELTQLICPIRIITGKVCYIVTDVSVDSMDNSSYIFLVSRSLFYLVIIFRGRNIPGFQEYTIKMKRDKITGKLAYVVLLLWLPALLSRQLTVRITQRGWHPIKFKF